MVQISYLAIEMINNSLKDYHLELIDGHAGCGNPALSIWEGVLVKEIFDSGKKVAGIVGLSCYDLAEKVGLITAELLWSMPTSAVLSFWGMPYCTLIPLESRLPC